MSHITTFIDAIAAGLKLDPATLVLHVSVQSGGPTVRPEGNLNRNNTNVVSKHELTRTSELYELSSMGYDSLGSNYVDFQLVQNVAKAGGKVTIPKMLYAFQHFPLPSNCGMCINRWVRKGDVNGKWTPELSRAGLAFRVALAHFGGYHTLVVTTGRSFSGDEVYDAFTKAYEARCASIQALDVHNFMYNPATPLLDCDEDDDDDDSDDDDYNDEDDF